jgi:hypothetical protein
MVWVYDHTRSLLVAMLMHVMIVFGSLVLIPTTPSDVAVTFDLVFAAELWLLVAAVAFFKRTQAGAERHIPERVVA